MLFKKKDQVQRLIEQARTDQKEFDTLRRKFESLGPEWSKLQAECERIAASWQATGDTYDRGVSEELWRGRNAELEGALRAAVAKRDALTSHVVAELQVLSDRIFHRNNLVSGSFGNWAGAVCNRLPEDSALCRDLMAARKRMEELTDMGQIIDLIVHWTDLVEAMEDVDCPLLKFDLIAAKALQISETAETAAA